MQNKLAGTYGPRNLTLVKGKGSYVWDDQGTKYLDCVSGISVNAFGHCYPPVVEAIKQQANTLIHGSNLYLLPTQIELANQLTALSGYASVFFTNSGTEAIEGALKFVRKYWYQKGETRRTEILTLESSFHGRTYGALAATGQAKMKEGFGRVPQDFKHLSLDRPEEFEKALTPQTAAILFEPILTEGGVISLTPKFLAWIKEAQKAGVQLICDEIQTGLGRTGSFFAYESLGIVPDVVTLAKPLGGGLPLGAILINQKVSDSIQAGDHGSTFGGNPVACAAGLAVLQSLGAKNFFKDIQERSNFLRTELKALIKRFPHSGFDSHLLGKGFIIGLTYQGDVGQFIQLCREKELLILKAGAKVVRILPPLNISKNELTELIEKMEQVLDII